MPPGSPALRVLMVTPRFFPYVGGVETHVHEVGRRLAGSGVAVTILTTDLRGHLPPYEEIAGMCIRRVRAWPANRDYYFAPQIYGAIADGKWDVVHCQGIHTLVAPLAMLAAWRAGIPYVVTFHSGGESSHARWALRETQWAALRPLLARAQRLVGVSAFEVGFFRDRLHLPCKQFAVIPNGADHVPTLPGPPRTMASAPDSPLIVSVGRLVRYKGHQRVIASLPKVREQYPDARLRIVGTGPDEASLRAMATRLGVADCVQIRAVPPGDAPGMARVFSQAALVTQLSEWEAQGLAAIEALVLGRPVLVADSSALRELAERGLARSVPLHSAPEDIAAAIVGQLRQPLVPRNVEWPAWDACVADLVALYHAAAGRSVCAF